MFREALGKALKEQRECRNLTLRYVAQKVPMSLGYLSEIERGKKEVSSEVLESISNVYGVSVSEIIMNTVKTLETRETMPMRTRSSNQAPVLDFFNGKTVRRMAG